MDLCPYNQEKKLFILINPLMYALTELTIQPFKSLFTTKPMGVISSKYNPKKDGAGVY